MANYTWQDTPTLSRDSNILYPHPNIAVNNANFLIELMKNNASTAEAKGGESASIYNNTDYLTLVIIQDEILSKNSIDLLQDTLNIIDNIKYCAVANAPHHTEDRSAPHYSSNNSHKSTNNSNNNKTDYNSAHCGGNKGYQGAN